MLWRAVTVSFARLCKNLRWMDPSSSSTTRGYAKSGCVSRSGPRSSATTRRPASVSSFAMIAPVHPIPTMTASTAGLTMAIASAPLSGQIDRRQRVRMVANFDPIGVIGAHAGIDDHFPCCHVLVAAVLGVAEIAHSGFIQQLSEEFLGGDIFQFQVACLRRLQQCLLVGMPDLRECLAAEMLLAVCVDAFDSHPQHIPHRQAALVPELGCRFDEWALHVPNVAAGIGRLHMTVDELRNTGFAGARTNIVRGNQSIAGRQDECPLGGVEKSGSVPGLCGTALIGGLIRLLGATCDAQGGDRGQGQALEKLPSRC